LALALNLLFDTETTTAVSQLWHDLAAEQISSDMLGLGYQPHLTLLVMDDESLSSSLAPALPELAVHAPSKLKVGDVSTFAQTEVVYLSCEGDLTQLRQLHRAAADFVETDSIRSYYRPSIWTPHVTLQTIGDVARAVPFLRSRWRSGLVGLVRLELATFVPVVVGDGIDLMSQP
jgi:2'-5' RNA ligase